MRFRLAVVLALVLGLFSTPAFAQLEYGVKAGIGFGTVSFDDEFLSEFYDGSRTGFIVGGGVNVPVNEMFFVGVELLYNQKGASGSESGIEGTAKLDYIEIPILATFPFAAGNTRPFVYGGFAPAFAVSRKEVTEIEGLGEDESNLDEEVKSFDNSLVLGGGVRFGQMAVEARYNLGLQNINDTESTVGDAKTRQFSILFSYFFGGNQ